MTPGGVTRNMAALWPPPSVVPGRRTYAGDVAQPLSKSWDTIERVRVRGHGQLSAWKSPPGIRKDPVPNETVVHRRTWPPGMTAYVWLRNFADSRSDAMWRYHPRPDRWPRDERDPVPEQCVGQELLFPQRETVRRHPPRTKPDTIPRADQGCDYPCDMLPIYVAADRSCSCSFGISELRTLNASRN